MRPAVASAVYVIDCGGGKLAHIRRSPHCGGYVSDDDPDNIGRMTGFVCEELDNRRKNGRSDYPVILALDNYPEIVNISDASVSDHINRILTSGKSVNVYVIATSPLPPGERLARFTDTALYLGGDDVYAASGFLKVSARDIPLTEDIPGRGIGLFDGVPLEFQAVLAKDHTGKSPPSPPDVIHYPYMPKTPTFTEFMERAATESEATEAVRNLPAGYQTKSGKLYSIPLERLKCVLIGGKSYSGRHTLLFNISVTAARYGIECVRADTYEALVSVCRTSAFSGIVTIENISELIDEFYSEIRSDEEEEELASLFDNSTIRSNSQRAHPVLIGIIDDRSAIHSGRKIYRKIFEHPYAIVLGGGLDESRIFDFSYLPFSILKKSHKRGDATILKFDEKLFDGPVTIPVTIDVDNSQT